MSDTELRQLALAHTASSTYATVGYTRTLNEQHQISFDVSSSKSGTSEGSEFYDAIEASGPDYYYNLQWISNSVFKERDSYVVSFRYQDQIRYTRYTVQLSGRIPMGLKWKRLLTIWA